MLLIAVSYRRCGRNFPAKLGTVINSLSANHAYLKTLLPLLQKSKQNVEAFKDFNPSPTINEQYLQITNSFNVR